MFAKIRGKRRGQKNLAYLHKLLDVTLELTHFKNQTDIKRHF
jgi:hypothetical protein